MKILVKNIDWDLSDVPSQEQTDVLANLPQTFFIPISDDTEYDEIEDEVSDAISDAFGFCHNGFDYEIVK